MKYIGMFFHAPMQSWGGQNMVSINSNSPKTTENSPTKSAVLGLIRSSLGIERGEDDHLFLSEGRFLTRTDCAGNMVKDYAIAQRVHHGFKAGPTKELPNYHLQDSIFLCLWGHENITVLDKIYSSLLNPQWAPFLGRRSYVPSLPIPLGTLETSDPINVLQKIPVFWNEKSNKKQIKISDSLVLDNSKNIEKFFDSPISWNMKKKKYAERKFSNIYFNTNKDDNEISKYDLVSQYIKVREEFAQ